MANFRLTPMYARLIMVSSRDDNKTTLQEDKTMTVIKVWKDRRTGETMRSVKHRDGAVTFERFAEPIETLRDDEGRWIPVQG